MKQFLNLLLALLSLSLYAQKDLTELSEIMKGEEFFGFTPERPSWALNGKAILFEWNPDAEVEKTTYYMDLDTKKAQKATTEQILAHRGQWETWDYKTYYVLSRGSLYRYDASKDTLEKILHTKDHIGQMTKGSSSGTLYLQMAGNIFRYSAPQASLVQTTHFVAQSTEKKAPKENFLSLQQSELFEYVRDSKERTEFQKRQQERFAKEFPKAFGTGNDIFNLSPSPSGAHVVFAEGKRPQQRRELMGVFITQDGYNQSQNIKSKVSVDNLFPARLGVYSKVLDSVGFINLDKLTASNASGAASEQKTPRHLSFSRAVFNEAGTLAVVDVRSQDHKDRWILSLDLDRLTYRILDHQNDPAWIGGPGIPSQPFSLGRMGFLSDDKTLFYQSEASGYSHLYTVDTKTLEKKQLTSGPWEVRGVDLSRDKKTFYLHTNTSHPGKRDFYRLSTGGGAMVALLSGEGAHEVLLSPRENQLLVRKSLSTKPWELYLAENKKAPALLQLTHSTTASFQAQGYTPPKVVSFQARDKATVYARVYPPHGASNGRAVLFVHGAGYLQNAHHYWSSYHREFMFHQLLSRKGYTVMDVDYRGSDGYGRDHRTGIYRHMGGKDLSDHLDAKKFLVENYGVDPDKVGIYGGSYGGFITLMALLTEPGSFGAGAALRSVTDWAHYNHGYTSNILNFPETDPEAYRKSSPIYFAGNLSDPLLMLHGMVDDNVEYKDIVRLSQRFIEEGKTGWELASYPVEAHGFRETSSWYDEYRRILEHFEEHLDN